MKAWWICPALSGAQRAHSSINEHAKEEKLEELRSENLAIHVMNRTLVRHLNVARMVIFSGGWVIEYATQYFMTLINKTSTVKLSHGFPKLRHCLRKVTEPGRETSALGAMTCDCITKVLVKSLYPSLKECVNILPDNIALRNKPHCYNWVWQRLGRYMPGHQPHEPIQLTRC